MLQMLALLRNEGEKGLRLETLEYHKAHFYLYLQRGYRRIL